MELPEFVLPVNGDGHQYHLMVDGKPFAVVHLAPYREWHPPEPDMSQLTGGWLDPLV